MNRSVVLTALICICTAIILGAFGAHGLEDKVSEEGIAIFETGVRYQMYMGLGMLPIGLMADRFNFSLKAFMICALFGVIIFSGLLYVLAFKEFHGLNILGAIVPIGGTLMIISWAILIVKLFSKGDSK